MTALSAELDKLIQKSLDEVTALEVKYCQNDADTSFEPLATLLNKIAELCRLI